MSYKRINITITKDALDKINQYCTEENVSKSFLIREAAITYIENIQKQKEIEKKNKEISEAIDAIDKIKEKIRFNNARTAEEMIREFRDSR